jgi:hypothetical protein
MGEGEEEGKATPLPSDRSWLMAVVSMGFWIVMSMGLGLVVILY